MLVVVLAALAAWLAAAATSAVRPARSVALAPPQIDMRGAALAAEIERLHDRLRPTAAPEHNRNLFQFAAPRTVALAPAVATPPSTPAPATEPARVEPPFKLIGVAEDSGLRTAILSSPSQLVFAKAGDIVAQKYRVAGLTADSVELTDIDDGHVLRLALK